MSDKRVPVVGDVWRSRDRRDCGVTAIVLAFDGHWVTIKRFRKSRVRYELFHGQYEFVSAGSGEGTG